MELKGADGGIMVGGTIGFWSYCTRRLTGSPSCAGLNGVRVMREAFWCLWSDKKKEESYFGMN